ncbi:isocitrate dehydrogenase kinase/phosphatase [Acrasis kona]|uniref:Isocitrate dehydrogenase kinase/phosphatase n=1 Tax=Acrasis kona TaxID=1008807 RepID=A0AAW2YWE5_9EUKA
MIRQMRESFSSAVLKTFDEPMTDYDRSSENPGLINLVMSQEHLNKVVRDVVIECEADIEPSNNLPRNFFNLEEFRNKARTVYQARRGMVQVPDPPFSRTIQSRNKIKSILLNDQVQSITLSDQGNIDLDAFAELIQQNSHLSVNEVIQIINIPKAVVDEKIEEIQKRVEKAERYLLDHGTRSEWIKYMSAYFTMANISFNQEIIIELDYYRSNMTRNEDFGQESMLQLIQEYINVDFEEIEMRNISVAEILSFHRPSFLTEISNRLCGDHHAHVPFKCLPSLALMYLASVSSSSSDPIHRRNSVLPEDMGHVVSVERIIEKLSNVKNQNQLFWNCVMSSLYCVFSFESKALDLDDLLSASNCNLASLAVKKVLFNSSMSNQDLNAESFLVPIPPIFNERWPPNSYLMNERLIQKNKLDDNVVADVRTKLNSFDHAAKASRFKNEFKKAENLLEEIIPSSYQSLVFDEIPSTLRAFYLLHLIRLLHATKRDEIGKNDWKQAVNQLSTVHCSLENIIGMFTY